MLQAPCYAKRPHRQYRLNLNFHRVSPITGFGPTSWASPLHLQPFSTSEHPRTFCPPPAADCQTRVPVLKIACHSFSVSNPRVNS